MYRQCMYNDQTVKLSSVHVPKSYFVRPNEIEKKPNRQLVHVYVMMRVTGAVSALRLSFVVVEEWQSV